MKLWGFALILLLTGSAAAATEVPGVDILRVPQPRGADDSAYHYSTGLLKKALLKAANGRAVPTIVPASMPLSTERKIHELRLNRTLDVAWLGGSKARGVDLLVVPIPLERGLVGYRQFIIRKDRIADFDAVKTLEDLKQLKACLDAHWVEADVFRDAQLEIVTSVNYEGMFKQLAAGRCDYLPRGFNEAKIDLAKRVTEYPQLMVYEPLILHYPFASYFYLNKDNKVIAQWLRDGLEKMIDDGELLEYMKAHEATSVAFTLASSPKRMLVIPNHYLPEFSNENDRRYWIQASEFVNTSD